MTKKEKRINEALQILKDIGMPAEQINDRTAICLLAQLDLPENKKWKDATNPLLGIRDILDFARKKLEVNYAENTRESIRKYSRHTGRQYHPADRVKDFGEYSASALGS